MDGFMDGQIYGWMDLQMDDIRQMYRWKDGWMKEQINGQTQRCKERQTDDKTYMDKLIKMYQIEKQRNMV